MQRGMLSLDQSQLSELLKLLEQTKDFPPQILNKLSTARVSKKNLALIELSENEAETILDSLPAVTKNQDFPTKNLTLARQTITLFLSNIRQRKSKLT
jgi:hypothetical protein